ncbi:MAG: hypothetical protein JWO62_2054 [Acidimicrobiaceae bacterium]|nr:hypothetical protein [Acidimicrobiaceae bacterium]
MRGDQNALRAHFAEEPIELRAVRAVLNRVDPYQDTVEAEQLLADVVARAVLVHDGFDNSVSLAKRC